MRCGKSQRLFPHIPRTGGSPRCARANNGVGQKQSTRLNLLRCSQKPPSLLDQETTQQLEFTTCEPIGFPLRLTRRHKEERLEHEHPNTHDNSRTQESLGARLCTVKASRASVHHSPGGRHRRVQPCTYVEKRLSLLLAARINRSVFNIGRSQLLWSRQVRQTSGRKSFTGRHEGAAHRDRCRINVNIWTR